MCKKKNKIKPASTAGATCRLEKFCFVGVQVWGREQMKQINGINLLNLRVLATALKIWQWYLLIPKPKYRALSSRLHSYT